MTQYHNKRLAMTGLFAAMTVALGVFETFLAMPVPGVRLGISNIGIMLALYMIDLPAALYIAVTKSILVPLLTGNLIVKMSIGLPATIAATIVMALFALLMKNITSPLSAGAFGGATHIVTQFVIVKKLYIKTDAIYNLLPYFTFFSVLTGALTGYITLIILKNLYEDDRCISCFKK
jgi:heptaprenyl diphosphate synthase